MKTFWKEASMGATKSSVVFSHTPSFAAKSAYFFVQSAGHFKCGQDYFTRREGLKSILLIYTIGGKGYANYRGRSYELTQGQVLIMDCYDFQEYYTDKSDPWEMKWLHFSGSTSEIYYKLIYDNIGPVISMEDSNSILGYLDSIMQLIKSEDINFEIKASLIITQILTEILLTPHNASKTNSNLANSGQIEAALSYISENYSSGISLNDLSRVACSSIYHFSRVFKKATGYSPYEYITKYRISRAKDLLKTTGTTIEEIAKHVGYESTCNFIRIFRRLEGITPLKYRKLSN